MFFNENIGAGSLVGKALAKITKTLEIKVIIRIDFIF